MCNPTDKLNIVLLLDQEHVPAWQRLMLERLLLTPKLRLAGVILQPTRFNPKPPLHTLLLAPLSWVDEKLLGCPAKARSTSKLVDLIDEETLFSFDDGAYRNRLDPPDVVIDLGSRPPPAEIMEWAKYGVWQYFFSSKTDAADHYTGIREYASQQREIVSGIKCWRVGEPQPKVLFYATSSLQGVPFRPGIEHTLWRMSDFMPQRLQELAVLGQERFFRNARHRLQKFPHQQLPPTPRFTTTLRALWRYPQSFFSKLYGRLFNESRWILLLGKQRSIQNLGHLEDFQKLIPPDGRFWADPFVVDHEDGQFIFFEELIFKRGTGHISCIRLHADGSHSEPTTVLQKNYHLSYPFVFQHQGEYYMIPETAQNHAIELYRCEEFPHRWVLEKKLMEDVEAFDTTLIEYQGRWWMFTNMRNHPGCSSSEALYLFYADSPLSETWHAHPQNPIESRVSHARPAGRIFEQGGKLYRPSQNCAGNYGRGLNINLIQQLDTGSYRETTSIQYLPEGRHGITGIHAISWGKNLCVMDAMYPKRYQKRYRNQPVSSVAAVTSRTIR